MRLSTYIVLGVLAICVLAYIAAYALVFLGIGAIIYFVWKKFFASPSDENTESNVDNSSKTENVTENDFNNVT